MGEKSMKYVNQPKDLPQNFVHKTFYCKLYSHELGYIIYLPIDYEKTAYPVAYHLHGWMGNELSDIEAMENICKNRDYITVFPNNSPDIENFENLPVEAMIINELIPHIETEFNSKRDNRLISGSSMGGGMAFYYAVKNPGMFSSVTAYAATFHHYLHKDYSGFGESAEKAAQIYETMMNEKKYFSEDSVFYLLKKNAEKIRGNISIRMHVGTADILFCENEIMHLFLNFLNIPHEYKIFEGAEHKLEEIIYA
jgi:enterochelin esterase-like enzyme